MNPQLADIGVAPLGRPPVGPAPRHCRRWRMSGRAIWRRGPAVRLVLAWLAAAQLAAGAGQGDETPAGQQRFAYFGDLHVHTMYSFDALRRWNLRATPDDAYRYAKGEAIPHPRGGPPLKLTAPLDFLAVTDHAEWLGEALAVAPVAVEGAVGYPLPESVGSALDAVTRSRQFDGVAREAWRRTIAAAERHNAPGEFTAFVGYEYTAQNRALHRCVIFKSAEVPALPFSALDSQDPEDLWDWMDSQRRRGIDALAIPHKMDRSGGRAFPQTTWQDAPIDRAFAEKRRRNEPLAEVVQEKGVSETRPALSPNDEWADFQTFRFYDGPTPLAGYWRQGLGDGLAIERRVGVNPYRLGAAGGSDSHLGAGTFDEANYFGIETARQRQSHAAARAAADWSGYTHHRFSFGTAGLTGIWAERNSRGALFDAMRRREAFATSGPRLRVRLFGGFGLGERLRDTPDPVAAGYRYGVPMGGVLAASGSAAPSFFLWALRDPRSGWLQRLQIVKGWLREGEVMERVFDAACSDGLSPAAASHRCPDNGAAVDLADCSATPGKGDRELSALWTDPDFDPGEPSYYYLRALENPSCRWSTWDAVRAGVPPNPVLPATIQERAWSSPIWYVPMAAVTGIEGAN